MPDKESSREMISCMKDVPWDLTENAVVKPRQRRRTDAAPAPLGRAPGAPRGGDSLRATDGSCSASGSGGLINVRDFD